MDNISKLLARVPKKHRVQLLETLECLYDSACRQMLQVKKLMGGSSLLRVRAGQYRIIFHIDDQDRAIVDDIRPRNEGTYRDI